MTQFMDDLRLEYLCLQSVALVEDLRDKGVTLELLPGQMIRVNNVSRITDGDRKQLRAYKPTLLALLEASELIRRS